MRVASFPVVSHALGGRQIQLVVVLRERPSRGSQALFLFSTDCQLAATQVVAWYAARFAIELGFRDLKQHFGLGDYQARRAVAAERHVTLCLVAYTWTQLLLLAGDYAPFGEAWRPAPALLTTGQLRYRLRQEQQAQYSLAICERQGLPAKKLAAIRADLTAAA